MDKSNLLSFLLILFVLTNLKQNQIVEQEPSLNEVDRCLHAEA